jgi:hypothetical protein
MKCQSFKVEFLLSSLYIQTIHIKLKKVILFVSFIQFFLSQSLAFLIEPLKGVPREREAVALKNSECRTGRESRKESTFPQHFCKIAANFL